MSPNGSRPSKVSEIHMARTTVPVHLSPIRFEPSSKGVHKITQASNGDFEKVRHENYHIPRRHNYLKSRSRGSDPGSGLDNLAITTPRIHSKLEKILSKPIPESGVFRLNRRFTNDDSDFARICRHSADRFSADRRSPSEGYPN